MRHRQFTHIPPAAATPWAPPCTTARLGPPALFRAALLSQRAAHSSGSLWAAPQTNPRQGWSRSMVVRLRLARFGRKVGRWGTRGRPACHARGPSARRAARCLPTAAAAPAHCCRRSPALPRRACPSTASSQQTRGAPATASTWSSWGTTTRSRVGAGHWRLQWLAAHVLANRRQHEFVPSAACCCDSCKPCSCRCWVLQARTATRS